MEVKEILSQISEIGQELQFKANAYIYEVDYTSIIDAQLNPKVKILIIKLKQLNLLEYAKIIEDNYMPIEHNAIELIEFVKTIEEDVVECTEWSSPSKNIELISKIAIQMQSLYTINEINPILRSIGVKELDNKVSSKRVYVQQKLSGLPIANIVSLAKDLGILNSAINIKDSIEIINSEYLNEQVAKCQKKVAEGDYDGAITNARTFLEVLLLSIAEKINGTHPKYGGDITKLYRKVSDLLKMSNNKYTGPLRKLLDGISEEIAALGGISDNIGDRHAGERYKPSERHALLVINSCFTIGDFFIRSYKEQYEQPNNN